MYRMPSESDCGIERPLSRRRDRSRSNHHLIAVENRPLFAYPVEHIRIPRGSYGASETGSDAARHVALERYLTPDSVFGAKLRDNSEHPVRPAGEAPRFNRIE